MMSASSEKELKIPKETDDGSPCKKICIRSSIEPDLTIIVGGVEFQQYSQTLCSWSEYFDKALKSGMKESHSKRFEFPDRDPKEWEWIMELSSNLTTEELSKDNIYTALDWYDLLCSRRGLDKCDFTLFYKIIPELGLDSARNQNTSLLNSDHMAVMRKRLDRLLDALEASMKYQLPRTKADCLGILQKVMKGKYTPCLVFTAGSLERLVSFLKDDKECSDELWSSFEMHLTKSAREQDKAFLISSGLLRDMVWLSIKERASLHVEGGAWRALIEAFEEELDEDLKLRLASGDYSSCAFFPHHWAEDPNK